MNTRYSSTLRLTIFLLLSALALAEKPKFQYKSEGIEVPTATADEPMVKAFGPDTIRAAAKYLDDGAHHWVREKACIACHSTGVYMVERSALTKFLGKPSDEVLADFVAKVPAASAKSDGAAIGSVWRSGGLASWDKHVTGTLSEPTARSLQRTMTLLTTEGFFKTYEQVEIPYITTDFELTVQAARAVVTAPGWLENLKDADTLARIERMKNFLREHEPVNDYELAMKLRLTTLMPELVPQRQRDAATAMLWRQQQPDGGWSTRRMSDLMKWHEKMDPQVVEMIRGEPDAASPASDAYMTSFAIVLLRESGVPASDERIQRGIAWLKANQRESGRWWMKSLFRDTYHYITYISTAQALRALALCGEVPADDAAAYAREIIASHGGAEQLLRIVKFSETYFLNGDTAKGTGRTSILQPPRLWFVGKTERVEEENKGAVCLDVWMWTLGPLVDPAAKLEVVPDIVIADKPAHGLSVSGSIEPGIRAYFDAATHDLVRIDWKEKQFHFSQPVAVDGTRVPSRCVLTGKDGKEIIRTELRDIQRLAELPADLAPKAR